MTRSVVIVAGPAMSGIPSGTTPKSSGKLLLSWDAGRVSSRTAMTKRTAPPAIWKSPSLIPMALKITRPRNRKRRATMPPVQVAWLAILLRLSAGTFLPSTRKTAARPTGSIVTKRGMKLSRNLVTRSMAPQRARPMPGRQSTLRPGCPGVHLTPIGLPADRPLRPHEARAPRPFGLVGVLLRPCRAPLEAPFPRPRRLVRADPGAPGTRALAARLRDPDRHGSRLPRDRVGRRLHAEIPAGPSRRGTHRDRPHAVHRPRNRVREQPGRLRDGLRLLRHRPDGVPAPAHCGGDCLAGGARGPRPARRPRAPPPSQRCLHGDGGAAAQLRRGHEGRGHPPRPERAWPRRGEDHAQHSRRRPRHPPHGR